MQTFVNVLPIVWLCLNLINGYFKTRAQLTHILYFNALESSLVMYVLKYV